MTVALSEESPEEMRANVLRATEWWEANDSEYLPYEVEFELTSDPSDADIVITTVPSIPSCGYDTSDEIRGCAPLLDPDEPATGQATIRIEQGVHPEVRPYILQHEFGHVLGLPHQFEPRIMQATAEFDLPDLQERSNPWARDTLFVYVDLGDYGGPADRFNDQVDHAMEYFEQGASGELEYDISFERTDDRSEADIVITGASFPDLDTGSTTRWYVENADSDPQGEWVHNQSIQISDRLETSAVGWHVASLLTETLGPNPIPETLSPEQEYHHRRSAWWRE